MFLKVSITEYCKLQYKMLPGRNSSTEMSILQGVFEGRYHEVPSISIENSPWQEDGGATATKAPLIQDPWNPYKQSWLRKFNKINCFAKEKHVFQCGCAHEAPSRTTSPHNPPKIPHNPPAQPPAQVNPPGLFR